MKFNLHILALLLTFIPTLIFAQADAYEVTTFTRDYQALTDATETYTSIEDWEIAEAVPVDLGFDFTVLGESITTAYFQDLSFIGSDPNAGQAAVGIGCGILDIAPRISPTGSLASSISYKVEGEPGTQIFKLEFKNVTTYENMEQPYETQSYFNYQLWLHEVDNSAEFILGDSYVNGDLQDLTGYAGPVFAIINGINEKTEEYEDAWFVHGDIDNPIINYNPPIEEDDLDPNSISLNDLPSANQVYRLAPTGTVATTNITVEPLGVYPTLTDDVINIKGINTVYDYQITDLNGKVIDNNTLSDQTIDVSTYEKGMYFVSLFDNGQLVKRGRFVKQ